MGPPEWIIIGIVALVVVFGAKKIPEMARSMGRAQSEFKKGMKEGQAELEESPPATTTPPEAAAPPATQVPTTPPTAATPPPVTAPPATPPAEPTADQPPPDPSSQ